MASNKKTIRTTVNLPVQAVEALKQIAAERNQPMSEVIRQAIATEKFLFDTAQRGGKILVEESDKTLKQIILR